MTLEGSSGGVLDEGQEMCLTSDFDNVLRGIRSVPFSSKLSTLSSSEHVDAVSRQITSSSSSLVNRLNSMDESGNNPEDANMDKTIDGGIKKDSSSSPYSITPLMMYLRQLGDSQREALEKVYNTAMELPCQTFTKCNNPLEKFPPFNCAIPFFKEEERYHCIPEHQCREPVNRNIVGPRSCEFCHAWSTLHCDIDCERPKLFLLKRRPPFKNKVGWDPVTEYQLDLFDLVDNNNEIINNASTAKNDFLVTNRNGDEMLNKTSRDIFS